MRKTNNIWKSGEFSVHYSDLAPMICQVLFMLLLIIVFFFLCREWLCYWHIRIVQSWLIQQWTLPHPWASVVWIRLQLQFGWWGRTYWSLWLYILRNESTSQLCQNEQEKKAVLFLLAVDTDIRGAAQSVTVTRLSDSTCGWGVNELQYSVWNVFAMLNNSVDLINHEWERKKTSVQVLVSVPLQIIWLIIFLYIWILRVSILSLWHRGFLLS